MLTSIANNVEVAAKTRRTENLCRNTADWSPLPVGKDLLAIQTQAVWMVGNRAKVSGRLTIIFLGRLQAVGAEQPARSGTKAYFSKQALHCRVSYFNSRMLD